MIITRSKYKSFKGILDDLGNADNAVLALSTEKRLTKNFKNELVKLTRTSDSTSRWFGYDRNGIIEKSVMESWVGVGYDGLVDEISNQGYNAIAYPAYQTSTTAKPKLIVNGVYQESGMLSDNSNDRLQMQDYTSLDFSGESTLSMYVNLYATSGEVDYIFAKNTGTLSDVSYGMRTSATDLYMLGISGGTIVNIPLALNTQQQCIFAWDGYIVGTSKARNGATTNTSSYTTQLTNNSNINLLNRYGASFCLGGYIKTFIIFNSNEYENYTNLVNAGI